MFHIIKNIFRFFVFSNLFVACCVLALFLSSEILLESKNYHLAIFVFFATIVTYNFQRIVRITKEIQHTRKSWLENYKKTIMYLMTFSAIISFYYFFSFNYKTQITIIISAIISLLYPFGLRQVPFLKIFIISIIWTISTLLILVFENNIVFDNNILLHLLIRLFFVFAITIPFDIRDLPFDNSRLKTIPIVFGEIKARIIGVTFLMFSELMCVVLFFSDSLSPHYFLATSISFLLASIFILNSNKQKSEMYFSFGVESASIIFYIILVVSSCMV